MLTSIKHLCSYLKGKEPNIPLFSIRICSLLQLAPLEAVLFDVDGTLCDTDPLHYDAFCEMLKEVGIFFDRTVPFLKDASVVDIICFIGIPRL